MNTTIVGVMQTIATYKAMKEYDHVMILHATKIHHGVYF